MFYISAYLFGTCYILICYTQFRSKTILNVYCCADKNASVFCMMKEDFERENEQQTALVMCPLSTFIYTPTYTLLKLTKLPCK
jgi:hypothetical protein